MNDSDDGMPVDSASTVDEKTLNDTTSSIGVKTQFWILCAMLALALIGMGLTQATAKGAWEFWLFVVFVYAALGLWRSTRKAKLQQQPVRQLIVRELGHWGTLLSFLGIVVLLERREIIDREAASDFALLLLALSCCLAGIHFDWLLLFVGIALTIMLVAMATVSQYSVVLWLIMILAAISTAAFFYLKPRNRREDSGRPPDK